MRSYSTASLTACVSYVLTYALASLSLSLQQSCNRAATELCPYIRTGISLSLSAAGLQQSCNRAMSLHTHWHLSVSLCNRAATELQQSYVLTYALASPSLSLQQSCNRAATELCPYIRTGISLPLSATELQQSCNRAMCLNTHWHLSPSLCNRAATELQQSYVLLHHQRLGKRSCKSANDSRASWPFVAALPYPLACLRETSQHS